MSPLALALVVAAALLHATWNLAAKKAAGDRHFALVTVVLSSLLWAPPALWFGAGEVPGWSATAWFAVLASAVIHVLYFQALLKGYRVADLTVVYPVARGSGPLLSAAGAVLLLGEALSAVGTAGVVAVCGGVFLIAGGPALWRSSQDPAARERVRAGIRWGAITGALIAGYTVIDAYTVKVLLVSPLMLDWVGNVLRVPVLAPFSLRDPAGLRAAWRANWKYALVVAVLGPMAYIMVLYAMTLAPLSHVAPAREMSMLFAALIGGRLLGEGDRGSRIAGAACIAIGVMALAVG